MKKNRIENKNVLLGVESSSHETNERSDGVVHDKERETDGDKWVVNQSTHFNRLACTGAGLA